MNTLKNLKVNNYSKQLLSEYLKVSNKLNNPKLREALFLNDDLLRFINNIQTKLNEIMLEDKDLNIILSSAVNDSGKTKYSLLKNKKFNESASSKTDNYYEFPLNFDSKFMAKSALKILNTSNVYCVSYSGTFCGVNLNIKFHSNKKWFDKNEDIEVQQKIVRILRRIIFVIKFFEKHTCHRGESLVFDLFLIDIPKKLPKKRLSKLDQESINSGYTTFFNDKKNTKTIIIYRGEEMEKLVIHELIHFFYLDFKHVNINMSEVLNVSPSNEFIVNEAFTEYLTIIIQSALIPLESEFKKSFLKRGGKILNTNNFYKNGIDLKKMAHYALEILYNETLFGYFQCAKILFQYNIANVNYFFKKYDMHNSVFFYQKSCIISYFFVKVALLTNINTSFSFFVNNQINYKISINDTTKLQYKNLVFTSIKNDRYQQSIQTALSLILKTVFKKKIKSKIVKSCKTKKRCIDKKVSNFKTHLSFKKQGKKSLKNLVINMRMSLIEL
jgi:hypothetical protein